MKLALGTVQFGMAYGVANKRGQITFAEAREILLRAWAAGIDTLDTAIAYGESEAILGTIGVGQWKVVSKLSESPARCEDIAAWVRSEVAGSLNRLKVPKLHALLLHRSQELLAPHGVALYAALTELKTNGFVDKIGVSVYGPEELEAVWSRFRLDIVQAPFNILDRRLVSSGWLRRMYEAGTEVHVRSVFLQGLLLMSSEERLASFGNWQDLWSKWDGWLMAEKLSPLQACLNFALSQPEIDRVIVGVDSISNLIEILSLPSKNSIEFPNYLKSVDSRLINPSKWTKP